MLLKLFLVQHSQPGHGAGDTKTWNPDRQAPCLEVLVPPAWAGTHQCAALSGLSHVITVVWVSGLGKKASLPSLVSAQWPAPLLDPSPEDSRPSAASVAPASFPIWWHHPEPERQAGGAQRAVLLAGAGIEAARTRARAPPSTVGLAGLDRPRRGALNPGGRRAEWSFLEALG